MFICYDRVIRETESATLFEIDEVEIWIPKSQHEEPVEEEGVVDVKRWFIEQEGLEVYTI